MAAELNYFNDKRSWMQPLLYGHSWWARLMRIIGAMLLVFLTFAVIALIVLIASASPFYAIIVAAPILALVVAIIAQLRRRWSLRVLFFLEAAARSNLPLPDYLQAASESEPGVVGRRLSEISRLLAHGVPLGDAITSGSPELTSHESRLLHAGERSGRLPEMLACILRGMRSDENTERHHAILKWYLPLLMIVSMLVCAFLVTFVMPKFSAIMRDFGITLHGVAGFIAGLPAFLAREWWILLVAVAAIIVVLLWTSKDVLRSVWPANRGLWRSWRLSNAIPIIGNVGRDRGLSDMCRMLSVEARAGIPLESTTEELSHLPLEGDLPKAVQRWKSGLDAGQSAADAAREAGMPALFCCVLRVSGPGMPDALDTLAEHYETRHGRVKAVLDAAAVPLVVGIGATFVILMALSVFLPMLAMIDHLVNLRLGGR